MENKLYLEDYRSFIGGRTSGHVKVICPFCHDRRTDKRDRSLSIDCATLGYKCHYCDAKGYLVSRTGETLREMDRTSWQPKKTYKLPSVAPHIKPEIDPDVAAYFKKRGISAKTLLDAKVTKETAYFGQDGCNRGCIAFNYYVDGEHVNTKYRTRDKHFSFVAGAKTVPYNIDSIAPSAYDEGETHYCIITEGEIDALTYIECGYRHTISMPAGANTNLEWLDDYIESHFNHLEVIYVSTDSDKKGVEARDEIVRRFGAESVKLVSYPKDCKDINEVIVAYGRDAVKDCFDNATDIRPNGIVEIGDVWESLDDLFHNGLQRGETVGVESLDNILSFKTGMLAVITGVPSHGKTFALNYLLTRLNILHDWKTAFFSPEFYPVREHMAQIIETLGGARFNSENYTPQVYEMLKDYTARNFFWIDPDDTDIDSILDRAKFLIRKKGIRVLVIDPFNAVTSKDRIGQKQDEYISDFLQRTRWFARKYDVLLCLVMHPTKQQRLENGLYPVVDLYACKGASEIYDKADIGLTVWRNEQENYAEFHVTKMKFRHLGGKGKATFRFNRENGRFTALPNKEDVKGQSMFAIDVPPDNTNWVAEKIKASQVQTPFEFVEQTPTVANADVPFGPPPLDADEPPF